MWQQFDSYRHHANVEAQSLKCNSSELLSLYSLLRHYAQIEVGDIDKVTLVKSSFYAACRVVDIILICKRAPVLHRRYITDLRDALSDHMANHVFAYGDNYVVPKSIGF